jgi:hypothetical protein
MFDLGMQEPVRIARARAAQAQDASAAAKRKNNDLFTNSKALLSREPVIGPSHCLRSPLIAGLSDQLRPRTPTHALGLF